MHIVMTPAEWDSAVASARGDNEDALDVRYTESGGRYLLVTHRHWQQRIPIVIEPATPTRGTR